MAPGRLAPKGPSLTLHDACYVALAELLDADLVTLDERLARASGSSTCGFRLYTE